jgi:transposase
MPWIQTEPEMERRKFAQAALRREVPMSQLCARFGISRKTVYKMLQRHAEAGLPGLRDASRARKTHPNQTPPEHEAEILRVRKAYPTWGSKKILWKLDRERPEHDWPARSTVDEILRRVGVDLPLRAAPNANRISASDVNKLAGDNRLDTCHCMQGACTLPWLW